MNWQECENDISGSRSASCRCAAFSDDVRRRASSRRFAGRDQRDPGEPRHGLGDIPPDQQADKNLPSWIPSTVQYARWGWRELEPQPGKIDYTFLDKVLKESHDSGQKLAFRVMCCSTTRGEPYIPHGSKTSVAGNCRRSGLVEGLPDPRHG